MKLQQYLTEAKNIKSILVKGVYAKQRVILGYKKYPKLYVHKRKNMGYCVTSYSALTLDDMVEIDGEFWFSTLKELHLSLNA